jgi:hypothetical protein
VFVDDRLVDGLPEVLCGLKLRGVSWEKEQADSFGNCEVARGVSAGVVEHENEHAVSAGLLAEGRQQGSKNGLETPLETYQKHSPVAGDTNAVT